MKIEGRLIKQSGDTYWGAELPEIGVFTQGKTKKQAYAMVKEAVELVVGLKGFKVSVEPAGLGKFYVAPSHIGPIVALILKQKRLEQGMGLQDVCNRLDALSLHSYRRYEAGTLVPSIQRFDEILMAINPSSENILKVS